VLTDLFGIAFLIPPVRSLVKRGVKAWIKKNVDVRVAGMDATTWQPADQSRSSVGSDKIVEAKVIHTHVEDARP
jgi:UPF0716 family protein affecting phage T7 exclusion